MNFTAKAYFCVLVDGKKRFEKNMFSGMGSAVIDINLNDNDRFLTLIVTEADDAIYCDWTLFVEPALELISAVDDIGGTN
jgi:hypothetical protein